jgi:hypothetical protein
MNRWANSIKLRTWLLCFILVSLMACATASIPENYHDPEMDFAALRTVAVMPFANLTNDKLAGERVRDTFMTSLLSTGVVYVIPSGEVARGISRVRVANPTDPTGEEISKLAAMLQVDAVITGVVREYREVRSGQASAGVISVSMQMIEKETRKVVWTAASTKGGISTWDRLLGGGGRPMNEITGQAVDDIINKLLY